MTSSCTAEELLSLAPDQLVTERGKSPEVPMTLKSELEMSSPSVASVSDEVSAGVSSGLQAASTSAEIAITTKRTSAITENFFLFITSLTPLGIFAVALRPARA